MGTARNFGLGLAIWVVAASAAYAEDQLPTESCDGLQSSDGQLLQAARINRNTVATPFSSFIGTSEHFKAGESVVVTKIDSGFACVQSAVPSKTNRDGWVSQRNVDILPFSKSRPATTWWLGHWNSDGSKVFFQILDDRFWASGASTWQGAMSPHFGEFEGHPFPHADGFRITADDMPDAPEDAAGCIVKMIAVGSYIALQDNGNCGGENVSFTGIYSRSHARLAR